MLNDVYWTNKGKYGETLVLDGDGLAGLLAFSSNRWSIGLHDPTLDDLLKIHNAVALRIIELELQGQAQSVREKA